MSELSDSLRRWRDRLQPGDVGLPARSNRRVPGLSREELAGLAGVSADYIMRLEQGRRPNPSVSIVDALARALRLTSEERDHLYRAAGHETPRGNRMNRHLSPGVQRALDRLTDVPVIVTDTASTVVGWNALAAALVGDPSSWGNGRELNIAWRHFHGLSTRTMRDPEEEGRFEREIVADLHAAIGLYPEDPDIVGLVADLRRASERFASLWETAPVAVRAASRKTIMHPSVGPVTVDCDMLQVQGSDLRLILYTTEPGSKDEEALRLIGVLGLQEFAEVEG